MEKINLKKLCEELNIDPTKFLQKNAPAKKQSFLDLKNPSEKVQLAAVKEDGCAIQYIKNPSEEVQLAAVNKHGYAIQYIENPSEAVQLAAVNQDGWAIQYIENPSEEVQLAAVKKRWYCNLLY